MNDKILVNVLLPATGKTYDLWVPGDMTIHDAAPLITAILESREQGRFIATPENTLFSGETGEMIDPCLTVGQAGLVCGSRLAIA